MLFKIVEIIIIDTNCEEVFILVKPILLETFDTHYESFIVSDNEEVLNNCSIYNIHDFSEPPINVTNVATGKRMICLKEYY